jgi:hypothetical protein
MRRCPVILRTVAPLLTLAPHDCGRVPTVVQATGRATHNAVPAGLPRTQYQVECAQCGVTTAPVYSQAIAEALWRHRTATSLHPLARPRARSRPPDGALPWSCPSRVCVATSS